MCVCRERNAGTLHRQQGQISDNPNGLSGGGATLQAMPSSPDNRRPRDLCPGRRRVDAPQGRQPVRHVFEGLGGQSPSASHCSMASCVGGLVFARGLAQHGVGRRDKPDMPAISRSPMNSGVASCMRASRSGSAMSPKARAASSGGDGVGFAQLAPDLPVKRQDL